MLRTAKPNICNGAGVRFHFGGVQELRMLGFGVQHHLRPNICNGFKLKPNICNGDKLKPNICNGACLKPNIGNATN